MNIRGKVTVEQGNCHLIAVVAGTSNHPLAGTTTKGTGDYISHLLVIQQAFNTNGSNAIYIADNVSGTIQVHGTQISGTAGAFTEASQRVIPLGVVSKLGTWRVTTQASVSVVAVGRFAR